MKFKALVAAASMVAFLPVSASALSVQIFDAGGLVDEVFDDGPGDGAGATADLLVTFDTLGGYSGISGQFSTVDNFPPIDDLSSTFTIGAGDGYLKLVVTNQFDNGLPAPTGSIAGTVTNLLGLGATASAVSQVWLGEGAYDLGTLLSEASGTQETHFDLNAVPGSPYWVTTVFEIEGFNGQSGTATAEFAAPVPLPAGILLMGTALAGFGVMRRRKKAA